MRPVAMEMGSVHSLESVHDLRNTPLPTPPDEKRAAAVKRLSYVLGFIYSLFVIILASTILVKTALINDPWTPIITIYVTVTGLVIMCVLIVDIKLFTWRIRKQVIALRDEKEKQEADYLRQLEEYTEEIDRGLLVKNNDDIDAATALNNTAAPGQVEMENIEHSYCFAQGKHAGSVYLKFGAAAFALGHFVHTVLMVVTVHWSIAITNAHCINVVEYIASLLQCLYCFVQLFFVFTYSNLIIVKQMTLARVAFLHMMAGNICLWVAAVTTETKLAYRAYEWVQNKENNTNITVALAASAAFKSDGSCMPTARVARIFDEYSAYLYPFTVEFNILLVGILFMVWRRIGKCKHSSEEIQDFHHSLYAQSDINGELNSPHALDIHINCRNAICGLFCSFFVIVVVIVTIILGFVLGNIRNEDFQHVGILFTSSMKLAFHMSMLVASGVAFYKTQSLDINKHPVPWLDDVLLYICVPAFFLESILTVIPTITALNIVEFLDTIVMSIQMIIQIAFIIDGLRRCSNSRKLRRTKPGRDIVLFLLMTNVSMWVIYTFSYKSPDSKDVRYLYYGKELWLAIGHLCTPIIMFFRFHSSVCIADIWVYTYKPGIEVH